MSTIRKIVRENLEFQVSHMVVIPGVGYVDVHDFDVFMRDPIGYAAACVGVARSDYLSFMHGDHEVDRCEAITKKGDQCSRQWRHSPRVEQWVEAKGRRYCPQHKECGKGKGRA